MNGTIVAGAVVLVASLSINVYFVFIIAKLTVRIQQYRIAFEDMYQAMRGLDAKYSHIIEQKPKD